jgi:multiple sugar transport system ATP-binding protein
MAEVIFKKVNKVFDKDVHVVKDLDLKIDDQEFMVLVGPSGCGKSTTLRMIAGLEEVTSGEIFIGERLINNVQPKDRDIAMVFQNYALYPHMTVYDNLAYGLKLRKIPKDEIKKLVDEAAGILGLSALLDRKPKALSGGQRQRVALGRAIVRKPKVFLFDEPLSNLDAKLRVQMRAEISKLQKQLKTTMVYVTHDQVEAMTMGDRISVMDDGIIQQVDTPLNLYDNPKNLFVAGFIGSPAMNFIEGKIEKKDDMYFVVKGIKEKIPDFYKEVLSKYIDKKIVLGIRPENVKPNKQQGDIKAIVEVVEPMGNEIIINCMVHEVRILCRIESRMTLEYGDTIHLSFDAAQLHFFDKESGECATYGVNK